MSMKNKRTSSCLVKMLRTVKPLNVSPVIKAARYTFLIFGMFYGSWKLQRLREYEKTASIIRHKKYEEIKRKEAAEVKEKTKEELMILAKDFDITEFPPNWDDGI